MGTVSIRRFVCGWLIGSLASFVCVNVVAQSVTSANLNTAQQAIDVKSLSDLEERWAQAVVTNNADSIGAFLSSDFLFVGAGGVLQTREQHLNDFRNGTLSVASIQRKAIDVHVYQQFAVVNTL